MAEINNNNNNKKKARSEFWNRAEMDVAAQNLAWPAAPGRRGDSVSPELSEHQMENRSQGENWFL